MAASHSKILLWFELTHKNNLVSMIILHLRYLQTIFNFWVNTYKRTFSYSVPSCTSTFQDSLVCVSKGLAYLYWQLCTEDVEVHHTFAVFTKISHEIYWNN